jgi:RNase P/RNase MRP subunit POP5
VSAKRPSRRYIGFRFEPPRSSRKDVGDAIERAWRAAAPPPGVPAPRLLVCEGGLGILMVATPQSALARKALASASSGAGIRLASVVSSGTIAAVKRRMLPGQRGPRASA